MIVEGDITEGSEVLIVKVVLRFAAGNHDVALVELQFDGAGDPLVGLIEEDVQ